MAHINSSWEVPPGSLRYQANSYRMRNVRFFAIALLLSASLSSCDHAAERVTPQNATPDGIVAKGAAWEVVNSAQLYSDSPVADANGNIYYAEGGKYTSDEIGGRIIKLDAGQRPKVFVDAAVTQGLVFGPEGYLYACRPGEAQIVRYSQDGAYEVIAQGEVASPTDTSALPKQGGTGAQYCNDLAVGANGGVWFTDRNGQRVIYVSPDGNQRTVASGFRSNGILLSLDKKMLVVTDSREPILHAFRVSEDGSLDEMPDFFDPLELAETNPQVPLAAGGAEWSGGGSERSTGANGMTVDSEGRFYVPTFLGVQILDKDGRHLGTIPGAGGYMSNLGFGGEDRQWLYSTGTQLSRLRMEAQGAAP